MLRHIKLYDFFQLSVFFPHIEHGRARLRRAISFSEYSPLSRLPVPLLNNLQKDSASPISPQL